MNSVNKFISILGITLVISLTVNAQSSFNDQFNFGKKLYEEEKYFDAVTEFKRLLFFERTGTFEYQSNKYIGLSYKQGGLFSDALRYFAKAEINAITADEIYEIRIEIIKVNILRRTTDFALKVIEETEKDPMFESKKTELIYWKGWAYIFADDWKSASATFAAIDQNHELKLISEKTDNEKYSVSFAKTISYFIPGAGQFYTGEYLSGLISLGWNVLWGYLTVNAFIEDRIFDGVMIGSLLWMRFYQGNIHNAEKFAVEKNQEISNKTLNYLQHEYEGPKP